MFDSINHLTKFSDWKKTFDCVATHLKPGEIFIFDINTPYKLTQFAKAPPWIHKFGNNFLIMSVECDAKALSKWDIKVFESIGKDRYRLHQEVILEKGFTAALITKALQDRFKQVTVLDLKQGLVNSKSERLYFVCKS